MKRIRVFIGTVLVLAACSLPCAAADSNADFNELAQSAAAAMQAHDINRAIDLYRTGTTLRPDWQPGWWFLGMLLYSRGNYGDSRDALLRLTSMNDQAAEAWGLIGMCESGMGRWADALTHVQKGLALGAGNLPQLGDVLRSNEALLLTRTGQFDLALERYARFLQAGTPGETLVEGVGLAALHRALLPSEIPAGDKELISLAGKAYVLNLSGRSAAAEPFFRELLARYPDTPGVHYLYGWWLMRRDDEAAMAELHRELDISSASPAAEELLAWILLMKEDYSSALPYAQAAAQADPASPIAQYDFGRALTMSGKVAEGIRRLERSAFMDPDNLETEIALACAYGAAGRSADAARERREALSRKESARAVRN